MTALLVRTLIAAIVIVAASEFGRRSPRLGGFILSLPLVSMLAMLMAWFRDHDIVALSRFARETLVFVVCGLPFFVPLAFAQQLGLGFWAAMVAGTALAAATTAVGLFLLS
ncbi:hypothetical protein LBMAG47_29120 [Planctomycetia bacterium]|jgi:hypothetical protein|nr:hypothetical protein LBMAG47_29120 [Planctomycetia bacterium]